jgi:hypothetical protein
MMLKCAATQQHSHTDRRRNVMTAMSGVVLPGDSTVKHVEVDVPEPGHGQGLLQMKASSICGSDIRAIYREPLGSGGHVEFLLAEEATCILLPDELSSVGGALTPHLHPLAHGATAMTRSLTRRPARVV